MIDPEIEKLIDRKIKEAQKKARYGTTNASYHTHNGIDSPKLAAQSLESGVISVTGSGTGISVSPTTGDVIVQNTGVTSLSAGTGITTSGTTGSVTITNAGVVALTAGTNVTLSGTTGTITVSASSGSGVQSEHWTLSVPNGTGDTAGSHVLAFAPAMVLATYRHTSNDMGALGIWLANGGENQAALPGGGLASIAGGGWLGIATGTPGTYVVSPSLSGTTLSYHYGNSSGSTANFDFWAIG